MARSSSSNLSQALRPVRRMVLAIALMVGAMGNLAAQVATSYTFSQSPGTYTEITGGTLLWGGANGVFDNQVSTAQTIPAFNFAGTVYTEMYVSANGFITFGSAPTGTNFTPLSSGEVYAGAISAFGADIENRHTNWVIRTVRWEQVGDEVVIQWKNVRRQNLSENFNFQIRLNTLTNAIVMVYGSKTTPASSTAYQPQVGLRGPNTMSTVNVANRMVGTGAENWSSSLAGTAATSTVRYTNTAPGKGWSLGQTYMWSPCTPNLVLTPAAATVCEGNSVELTANGAGSYTWSPATDLNTTTGSTVTSTPTDTIIYTVTGTTAGCAFVSTAQVKVDVVEGSCSCGGIYADTDADGTCDLEDGCPNDPGKTWEGVCGCGVPDVDGDGDTVMDCLDGCPSDPNKIAPGECGCGVADSDTDGDGTADCNDQCPNDPNKTSAGSCGCGQAEPGMACDDGNPNTGNDVVNASCQCVGQALDCAGVPGGAALPGTPCDDGNAGTINDVYTANCGCMGTPTNHTVGLTITTDAFGVQTRWEIIPQGGGATLCSGGGYANNTTVVANCTLPDGCYELRVLDSFGDGMATGGYVLRDGNGERIIDNTVAGNFGAVSQIANNGGFCLPLGSDRLRASRCDLENLLPTDWIAAEENEAVSAQFGVGDQTDDGYQFWFFDPNGSYSRRVLVTHANSSYLFPWGAARASHLRLSDVITSPLPHNMTLNVRVRTMVNSVYGAFGPACRLRIDLLTQCPTTQLVDDLTSPNHSCGITDVVLDGSQHLYTEYISNTSVYQWEFADQNSAYVRQISSEGSALLLTEWATLPLQYGTTYDVRVRVSYDNGANWCPWGNTCTISTAAVAPGQGDGRDMIPQVSTLDNGLRLWPNPNRGDVVNVLADGLPRDLVNVDLLVSSLNGRILLKVQVPVTSGSVRYILPLNHRLTSGTYLVTMRTGTSELVQRLIIL